MKAQEEIKTIETKLINRLCWIPDPETILPHMVFVEDVNDNGEPEYYHCTLEAINRPEKTCTLLNHSTGKRSSDWKLTAINIDWLVTLWNWYKEKHAENETDTELLYLAESGEWYDRAITLMSEYTEANEKIIRDYATEHWQNLRSDKANLVEFQKYIHLSAGTSSRPFEKDLFAYVFPASRLERNATDAEILADYENNQEEEELTAKFTPDEFAAYCNDGFFNELDRHVRFIRE